MNHSKSLKYLEMELQELMENKEEVKDMSDVERQVLVARLRWIVKDVNEYAEYVNAVNYVREHQGEALFV